jgi:hypothetical protein
MEIGTKKEARITVGSGIVEVGMIVATGGLGCGGRVGAAELIGKRLKSRGEPSPEFLKLLGASA